MYKFRTMTNARSSDGELLPDALRLTPFGLFLRSTSLDELPELINVLRGEMSIVGPRPLLMEYLNLYSPEQARRHEVRPGITGWAQVNGRNAISWEEKFRHDVWYVDHHSLRLDLLIFLLYHLESDPPRRHYRCRRSHHGAFYRYTSKRMSGLLILGGGGHAEVVAETALASGHASCIGFLDDRPLPPILGWPVLGRLDQAFDSKIQADFPTAIVAIGHSRTRLRLLIKLRSAGYRLPLLVHPSAWISPSAQIGPGSVVFAQAVLQAQARDWRLFH